MAVIQDIQRIQSNLAMTEMLDMKKPQSKQAEIQFLGHVLNTMFEEMVPETLSFGTDPDNNTRLMFGLYLNEIFQQKEVVESFGITNLLNHQSYDKKTLTESRNIIAEAV